MQRARRVGDPAFQQKGLPCWGSHSQDLQGLSSSTGTFGDLTQTIGSPDADTWKDASGSARCSSQYARGERLNEFPRIGYPPKWEAAKCSPAADWSYNVVEPFGGKIIQPSKRARSKQQAE